MKKIIPALIIIILVFAGADIFAQNASADKFRVATPQEILLHDNPYNILQREIETNICDANWSITQKPFLLSANPNEKIIIINYLEGVGNVPVFKREGESFEIKMNQESPLFKAYLEENKKQTEAFQARSARVASDKKEAAEITAQNKKYFNYINQSANRTIFGDIFLELNQNNTIVYDLGDTSPKQITAPGINHISLFVQLPDESSVDTIYNAILYIGNWPKLSNTKMVPFHFTKNNSSAPVIENMIIKISGFNYNKIMKMIHSIDWTKLEALIKK